VPDGLSAQPVFSIDTRDAKGGNYRVVLTYIAAGFDWQAHYVAALDDKGADGKGADGKQTATNGTGTVPCPLHRFRMGLDQESPEENRVSSEYSRENAAEIGLG